MKRIFSSLVATVLISAGLFAQNANVVLFAEQGEKFTVIINGVQMNDVPETNVKVTEMNNDYVTLKIRFEDASIPDIDKSALLLSRGNEVTYKIKKNKKGEYVVNYASEAPVASATTTVPGQRVIIYGQPATSGTVITTTSGGTTSGTVTTGSSTTTTTTTTTSGATTNGAGVNVVVGSGLPGETIGMNVTITDGTMGSGTISGGTTTTTYQTTTTTTTSGTTNPTTTTTTTNGCLYAMGDSDFRSAKTTISGQSFDDDMLKIAKQVASSNCLTAQQIKEIMLLMSFEDNRLDFAKYAYSYCYDKNNYYKINDAFSFSSSVDELNTYIGH